MTRQEFNKLPLKEKRILIAKDVILQIEKDKFEAYYGRHIELKYDIIKRYNNDIFGENNPLDLSLQKVAKEYNDGPICYGCAKGSILFSHIMFVNKFTLKDVEIAGNEEIVNHMKGIFTENQLDLIEIAFETKSVKSNYSDKIFKSMRRAIEFGKKFITPKKRLIAIMENIIENEGIFIP